MRSLLLRHLGALLLAALARVMDTAEDAYLARLRRYWHDETLQQSCLAFLRAHHEFWNRNARLLHMRNALADAGDLRVLRYRNDATLPLIDLLAGQIADGGKEQHMVATVLLTGLERVAMNVVQPAGMDGEVKLLNPITMENIADVVLADGLASAAEIDGIVAELYAFARRTRTVVSVPRIVQTWRTRPASSGR